jgi:hypothetical protein
LGLIGKTQYHQFNNLMANPTKLHHTRPKGPSWNKVVPHHILLSKGERIGVEDLGAFIINKIGVFPW